MGIMAPLKKEILYEGYFYDVTEFLHRHPGGFKILDYHTAPGEDATIPIQQFHNRNFKKVMDILKTFKRRPASPADHPASIPHNPLSAKNKALTDDYLKLFRELQREGFFEPSYAHVAYRLTEPVVLTLIAVWMLGNWGSSSYWGMLAGCWVLAMAKGRCGWAMHEAGHHSLTGNADVDRVFNSGLLGLSLGISATWWRQDHMQHHAMTNRLGHDVDLHLDPLVCPNVKAVDGKPNFILKYQKYFIPLDAIIMLWYWKWWHSGTTLLLKTPYLPDFLFIGLHYYLSWKYLTLPTYLLAEILTAYYVFSNFGLNHSFLPVRDEPCHWAESTLLYTADVEQRPWCDWWMGYLNYQIEHHLFPTMPQYKNKRAVGKVRAFAERNGLPYYVFSYWEAMMKMIKNVMDVEDKLRSM